MNENASLGTTSYPITVKTAGDLCNIQSNLAADYVQIWDIDLGKNGLDLDRVGAQSVMLVSPFPCCNSAEQNHSRNFPLIKWNSNIAHLTSP
ncbi:MAG TPA: hypothetical protein PLE74_07060 [Candidatus Cloacimonadota bacterium]|nr:hypothetical protein [Candidatus Cloacimonadota bacterium]